MGLGEVAHPAVAAGGAFVRGFKAGQDPQQGGFAGTVFADDGHVLAGGDDQVDAVQELRSP